MKLFKRGNVIENGGKAGASLFQSLQRVRAEAKTEPSSSTGNQCKIFLLDITV